ncbi:MAG: hypothetical protein M0R00_08545 [Candidatus Omnitrophica bacterium]|jgi:hypothetical protein|nr:hypothetical protein [Candidatus Omnitrophota bacterium]
MPERIINGSQGLFAALAGTSGFLASIVPALPDSTLETLGRWPLTVILGAVCVICILAMLKQSKDAADRSMVANETHCKALIAMAEGERQAAEKRTIAHAQVTKELADSNIKAVREQSENHAKEMRVLLDEFIKQRA